MICNKCNHKLPDDSEFCQYCGNRLEIIDNTDMSDMPDFENMSSEDTLKAVFEIQTQETLKAMGANKQSQPNNESDANFGLIPEKPIYTFALKSVDGETEYLNKLYTENCEKIKWSRRGSTGANGIHGIIDIYDTYLPSGQFYKTIYINMYGSKTSAAAPKGFILRKDNADTQKTRTIAKHSTKTTHNNLNSIVSIISITLSVIAILSIIVAMLTQRNSIYSSKNWNPPAVYLIFLLLYSSFIIVEIIAKKQRKFTLATWTSPILAIFAAISIVGYLSFSNQYYGSPDYHFQYINNDETNICNLIFIASSFAIPVVNLLSVIVGLVKKMQRNYYTSMKYREKCYKKVAHMKKYLDNGIITEAEFKKNKEEIMKNIRS